MCRPTKNSQSLPLISRDLRINPKLSLQIMKPHDCPSNWEYKDHTDYTKILPFRCRESLVRLRDAGATVPANIQDTRHEHGGMFAGLTPPNCDYFAGHYRGEEYRCLRYYDVQIASDPLVGAPYSYVAAEMEIFGKAVLDTIAALDAANELPTAVLPEEHKLLHAVQFACRALTEFLRIHPYANGNGHIGRWLVIALLNRYGYWPKSWPLDGHPPYDKHLYDYRRGHCDGLESFVLSCCIA